MSDIQNPNGFEVNEAIDSINDLLHIYQPGSGGVRRNKKTLVNTFLFPAVNGMNHIVLTNYATTGVPAIAANSQIEINGNIYTNPSEVAITGTTVNDTWYGILLTPVGTTFTASFVADNSWSWSDSKHGLYTGNNRVVAHAKRDTSSTVWINKNILIVNNRTVKIKIQIGDWDALTATGTDTVDVSHPIIGILTIRSLSIIIKNDAQTATYKLETVDVTTGLLQGGVVSFSSSLIRLGRYISGFFDSTDFDSTGFNRGWITLEYEV